jgi:AraC-like DNA-binding protein
MRHCGLNCVTDWYRLAEEAYFSPEALARYCGTSSRTLRRVVRERTGKNPQELLKEYRLLKAFDLLLQGYTVKEVAYELHYKQLPQFSREFNKFFGAPPTKVYELRELSALAA